MTQPRSDVVLFNFVYGGPKPYLAPSFQLFLKSAEYSGADIIFVGDTLACGEELVDFVGRKSKKAIPPRAE